MRVSSVRVSTATHRALPAPALKQEAPRCVPTPQPRRRRGCSIAAGARQHEAAAAAAAEGANSSGPSFDSSWLRRQSLVMGSASAVLGPLCDGQHSSHDVLHYLPPGAPVHLALGPLQLETAWWVPGMFAIAGVILGVTHPLLDAWQLQRGGEQPRGGSDPGWPLVLAGIALFVLQYASSGALEQPLLGVALPGGVPALDAFLFATAAALWWAFDGTRQGAFMAALTAVAGPAVEMTLIHFGMYAYTHPVLLGTPTWICWVYAAGAPAVGNLGRKVSSALLARREQQRQTERQ